MEGIAGGADEGLVVSNLHVYYGSSHILQGVSLEVDIGETVALLGRNGAGKTTTMRAIMGLAPIRSGKVTLFGQEVTGRRTDQLQHLGVAFVPSGRRVFGSLTVLQNLELAARAGHRRTTRWTLDRVEALFPALAALRGRRAAYLSGGEQQMLKLACALLGEPRFLLLDEPTEGLAPTVVQEMGGWLAELREEGFGILLAEQNAVFALRLAQRCYVLEKGVIRAEHGADELLQSEEGLRYLGVAKRS
jgi:branched-chain amino acid transport system ATP-binding protein